MISAAIYNANIFMNVYNIQLYLKVEIVIVLYIELIDNIQQTEPKKNARYVKFF